MLKISKDNEKEKFAIKFNLAAYNFKVVLTGSKDWKTYSVVQDNATKVLEWPKFPIREYMSLVCSSYTIMSAFWNLLAF